jgi:hypothetical protein
LARTAASALVALPAQRRGEEQAYLTRAAFVAYAGAAVAALGSGAAGLIVAVHRAF